MVNLHVYKPRHWQRLGRPADLRMSLLKCVCRVHKQLCRAGSVHCEERELANAWHPAPCRRSMATQLVQHERILTTLNKAQALQRYADGVIALAKKVCVDQAGCGSRCVCCKLHTMAAWQLLHVTHTDTQGTSQAYNKAAGIMRTDAEVHKLFTTLALRYHGRQGGFTRVVPAGFRHFDATPMAYIE